MEYKEPFKAIYEAKAFQEKRANTDLWQQKTALLNQGCLNLSDDKMNIYSSKSCSKNYWGKKWDLTRVEPGPKKYVICNADEGDPGAFMDRSIMEGNPNAVIEGMMIAARAIGADEGYIYVRMEYLLAVQRMRTAIKQAEELGVLGKNIFGSGKNFDIHVMEGAGQPQFEGWALRKTRAEGLYQEDTELAYKSQDNSGVQALYGKILDKIGGPVAHELLHTHYKSKKYHD